MKKLSVDCTQIHTQTTRMTKKKKKNLQLSSSLILTACYHGNHSWTRGGHPMQSKPVKCPVMFHPPLTTDTPSTSPKRERMLPDGSEGRKRRNRTPSSSHLETNRHFVDHKPARAPAMCPRCQSAPLLTHGFGVCVSWAVFCQR